MIEFKPYEIPLTVPYQWSKGTHLTRKGLIVRIQTENHVGWGEAILPPDMPFDEQEQMELAKKLVSGLEVQDENFIERLDERKPPNPLRHGITTAWFSARASLEGKKLADYLLSHFGINRSPETEIPYNALITDKSVEDAVSRSIAEVKKGITTLKVKCFDHHEQDNARIAAIREALPDVKLRLDPNEAWGDDALERLNYMAQYQIEYVEQPIPVGENFELFLEKSVELRKNSPIKIALDQSVTGIDSAREILHAGAADVLILKLPAIGGIDRAIKIGEMAESHGVPCVMTSGLETVVGKTATIHCAAIMPPPLLASGLSLGRFFKEDVADDPEQRNGYYLLPEGSGLGIDPSDWWNRN